MANDQNNQVNVGLNLNGNAMASVQALTDHMNALKKVALDVGAALNQINKESQGKAFNGRDLKRLQQQMKILTTTPDTVQAQYNRGISRAQQDRNLNNLVSTREHLSNPNTLKKKFDQYGTRQVGEAISIRLHAAELSNDMKAIKRAQLEMQTYKAEMAKYNQSLKGLHEMKIQQDALVSSMLSTPVGAAALRNTAKGKLERQYFTGAQEKAIQGFMADQSRLKPRSSYSMDGTQNRNYMQENQSKIEATKRLMSQQYLDGSVTSKAQLETLGRTLTLLEDEKVKLQAINNLRRSTLRTQDEQLKNIRAQRDAAKANEELEKLMGGKLRTKTMEPKQILRMSEADLYAREFTMTERLKQAKQASRAADTLGNKKALEESNALIMAYEKELKMLRRRKSEMGADPKQNSMITRFQEMNTGESSGALLGMQGLLLRNYMLWGAFIGSITGSYAFLRDFENALKQTQAISQATDTQVQQLSHSILKVAENSRFTAIEITEAATALAQAGFSMSEIETTLESVTLLATATGSTLKETVDIATASLGAFQLSADNMPKIVNQITQAMNLSKLDIQKFQLAVQYAGNAASDAGLNFEELLASVSTVANAGVRSGSTLGTGFRQLLSDMIAPSTKFQNILERLGLTAADVDVRTNGLVGALKKLKDAGFTTNDAYESFEVRSVAFYTALSNNLSTYDDLLSNLDNNTAAMEANDIQMGSLAAQTDRMFNQFKSLAEILGGDLRSALTDTFHIVGNLLGALRDLSDNGVAKNVLQFTVMAGTLYMTSKALVGMYSALAGLRTALMAKQAAMNADTVATNANTASQLANNAARGAGAAATTGAARAAGMLHPALLALSLALTAAYTAYQYFTKDSNDAKNSMELTKTVVNELSEATNKLQTDVQELDKKIVSLESRFSELKDDPAAVAVEMNNLQSKAYELGIALEVDLGGGIKAVREGWEQLRLELGKEIEMNLSRQVDELQLLAQQMASLRSQEARKAPEMNSVSGAVKGGYSYITDVNNPSQQVQAAGFQGMLFKPANNLKQIMDQVDKIKGVPESGEQLLKMVERINNFQRNLDSYTPEEIAEQQMGIEKDIRTVVTALGKLDKAYLATERNSTSPAEAIAGAKASRQSILNLRGVLNSASNDINSVATRQRQSQTKENERMRQSAENKITGSVVADLGGKLAGNQNSLIHQTYAALLDSGLSHNQATAMIAQIGRENDFNIGTMFGSHNDPARGKNMGLLSWQGDRRPALMKFLKERGVLNKDGTIARTQAGLQAQTDFAALELRTGKNKAGRQFYNNPNISLEEANKLMGGSTGFVGWARGQDTIRHADGTRTAWDWRAQESKGNRYADIVANNDQIFGNVDNRVNSKYRTLETIEEPENIKQARMMRQRLQAAREMFEGEIKALGDPTKLDEAGKKRLAELTAQLTATDTRLSKIASETQNAYTNLQTKRDAEMKQRRKQLELDKVLSEERIANIKEELIIAREKISSSKFSQEAVDSFNKLYTDLEAEQKKLAENTFETDKYSMTEYQEGNQVVINKKDEEILLAKRNITLSKMNAELNKQRIMDFKKATDDFLKTIEDDYKLGVDSAMSRVETILSKYKEVQSILDLNEGVKRFRLEQESGVLDLQQERSAMDTPANRDRYSDSQRAAYDQEIERRQAEISESMVTELAEREKTAVNTLQALQMVVAETKGEVDKLHKKYIETINDSALDSEQKAKALEEINLKKTDSDNKLIANNVKVLELEKEINSIRKERSLIEGNMPEQFSVGDVLRKSTRDALINDGSAKGMERDTLAVLDSVRGGFHQLINTAIEASDNVDDFFKILTGGSGESREAFKALGYGIVETMAKVVQDRMVNKFIDMMTGFLFPETEGGFGGLGGGKLVGQNASKSSNGGGSNQWLGILAQIGGAFASAWGGSWFGGATATAGGGATSGSPLWSSGGTTARFMSQGGAVRGRNSATNVDSVPAMLADGEYVMPSHVVDTLGLGYMERMRSDPNSVLNDSIKVETTGKSENKAPPSMTNVYVVSKDNVPSSVSQNDIIVAVEDNIARNGSVKKLIKQVANGQV